MAQCNDWNVNYITFQWFTISVNTPRVNIVNYSLCPKLYVFVLYYLIYVFFRMMSTHMPLSYLQKLHVNICGNVVLSIMLSSGRSR